MNLLSSIQICSIHVLESHRRQEQEATAHCHGPKRKYLLLSSLELKDMLSSSSKQPLLCVGEYFEAHLQGLSLVTALHNKPTREMNEMIGNECL